MLLYGINWSYYSNNNNSCSKNLHPHNKNINKNDTTTLNSKQNNTHSILHHAASCWIARWWNLRGGNSLCALRNRQASDSQILWQEGFERKAVAVSENVTAASPCSCCHHLRGARGGPAPPFRCCSLEDASKDKGDPFFFSVFGSLTVTPQSATNGMPGCMAVHSCMHSLFTLRKCSSGNF